MALYYDFYENPQQEGSGDGKRFHVRVVTKGTVTTDMLASDIRKSSSLTEADVKGVLTALVHALKNSLKENRRVHVEGLGYFQLTLACPPVSARNEIRAESIRVKSIIFRPESDFRKSFRTVTFRREPVKRHSIPYSEQEMDSLLNACFRDTPYLTAKKFEQQSGLTHATAARRLKQLVEAGKLRKVYFSRYPLYEKNV
ncbi:MAG: HU family DNA-binding protein [Tannerella sp.]|jgi:predicted histone-like DNA-binding protein|nr:HU family DNA-binding protein [Tannerella sp.]